MNTFVTKEVMVYEHVTEKFNSLVQMSIAKNIIGRHIIENLNLSQTSACFYLSTEHVFSKYCGKRRNCS